MSQRVYAKKNTTNVGIIVHLTTISILPSFTIAYVTGFKFSTSYSVRVVIFSEDLVTNHSPSPWISWKENE
jgi:hypothetical protein